ncbi:MAG: YHS domain-containing protein [Chlorobiaceae bacterium]|nr:YHS domain-containing protein [Chlorobiaceae bacterium]
MTIDPVCKMKVEQDTAPGKSQFNGKTYYFCAISCKKKFDADPKKYLDPNSPAEPMHRMNKS